MNKRKTLISGFLIFAAILSAVLITLHFLSPRIINSEIIKDKIQTSFTQYTGGVVEFDSLDVSMFPRPHVTVYQGSTSVPDLASGVFNRLKVYPKILPLFTGTLQVAKIGIVSPQFIVDIHQIPDMDTGAHETSITAVIQKSVTAMAAAVASGAPDLIVKIEKGSINIVEADKPLFSFSNINSKIVMPPEGMKVDLSCSSSYWKHMSMTVKLDPEKFSGKGKIDLVHFNPKDISASLFPNAALRVNNSRVNLYINFTTADIRTVSAELDGSIDYLTFQKNDITKTMKSDHLKAFIEIKRDRTAVKLTSMSIVDPKLKLSGKLILDEKEKHTELEVRGKDVDVAALRETVLAFAGEQFIVKEICTYLQGGDVPFVEFTSKGSTLHDLYDPELFIIRGNIRKGKVFVHGPDLAIENVKGDVLMQNGILEGSNISSEMDDAIGTNGKIRIGLIGKDPPLYVETHIRADLSRVPPVLGRVIKNKAFIEEMNRLHKIKGTASGKFSLGDRFESVRAKVEVDEVSMSAEYDRIPFALKIKGGQFHYDESAVGVKNLQGVIGNSSFSGLTADLALKEKLPLKIHSAKASIFLDELYPWVTSFKNIRTAMKEFETFKGTLGIQSMTLDGPLMEPAHWLFKGEGGLESVMLKTTLFPEIIHIKRGELRFDEKRLSFKNSQIAAFDALFNVSGDINGYLEGVKKTDLDFAGEMGPNATKWTSAFIKLPPELSLRAPLLFSQGHLSWERDIGASLNAHFTVNKVPEVTLDIQKNQTGLVINKLIISDEESFASLSIGLKDKEYDFHFTGNLTQTTMDNIFLDTQLKKDWLKGDFEAHIMLDNPGQSSFKGWLEGKDLIVPWSVEELLTVSSISLHGSKNGVRADSVDLLWGDRHITVKGDVTASDDAFLFDMDISADKIAWDIIKEPFQRDHYDEVLIDFPVKGTLRVRTDDFRFDRLAFNAVQADIVFNRYNADVNFNEADLCGISFPGVLKVTSQDLSLNFQTAAANQEMEHAVECLFGISKYATGSYTLDGNLVAKGRSESLVDSLQGDLSLLSKDGRIYQYGLISKVFSFINLTEIFRGRAPDLVEEGFAYETITGRADIQGSKLILKEFIIDGSSMQIAAQGTIDIIDKKVDLKVLVAPLKTVDFVIRNIPVIKDILGGTLISIPVRVRGDYTDPHISYLSPVDIGSGLLGILENALKAPGHILDPDVSGSEEKE